MPFFTLEGIDGSGKSTVISIIQKELEKRNANFIAVREPGSTGIGEKIRDMLLDPNVFISPVEEVYLYATSRAIFVRRIVLPALNSGKLVISERYVDSSFAYQGYGKGVPLKFIYEINKTAISGVFPNLTVLLDIDPSTGIKRLESKKKDRLELEGLNFYERVRDGYLKLAERFRYRYMVVDGTKEPGEIASIVLDKLERFMQ
ncbi:MAG: dTMP kinase [Dictyoglomi bacterium]|nr:dTMP kinase [Dictyoglomota bacterium]HOL55917.1 dTMP kinase [bacterium]